MSELVVEFKQHLDGQWVKSKSESEPSRRHNHYLVHLDRAWAKQPNNDTRHIVRYHLHPKSAGVRFWQQHELQQHIHQILFYPPTFNRS